MAVATGLSHSTIRRIRAACGLQPHRSKALRLSTAPFSGDSTPRIETWSLKLVDKVRDIAGLYMPPPERAVVLCVDESERAGATGSSRPRPRIRGPDREQPALPLPPGVAARRTLLPAITAELMCRTLDSGDWMSSRGPSDLG